MDFCIRFADLSSNGLDDRHGHAIACLLIRLRIGVDGKDLIDLVLAEPLQPEALARHESADSSAAHDNAVCIGGIHSMRDILKHAAPARVAARESKVNGIAFMCFLEAFLRSFLDIKHTGVLTFEIGKRTVLPGIQAAGSCCNFRITLCQIYKVES